MESENSILIEEIYIVSSKEDFSNLEIEGTNVLNILKEVNDCCNSPMLHLHFQPVPSEYNFSKLDFFKWEDEINFRNRDISVVIIDGRCIETSRDKIYTVRAHFFPFVDDLPLFCVINPQNAFSTPYSEEDALQKLESEFFRFKLIPPKKTELKRILLAIYSARKHICMQNEMEGKKPIDDLKYNYNFYTQIFLRKKNLAKYFNSKSLQIK